VDRVAVVDFARIRGVGVPFAEEVDAVWTCNVGFFGVGLGAVGVTFRDFGVFFGDIGGEVGRDLTLGFADSTDFFEAGGDVAVCLVV
jgi:hypothetical protein